MPLDMGWTPAPLGHEIRGVDLSKPLSDALFAEIEAAFDAYGVIVFRDQTLTPDQHVAFSGRFGPHEPYLIDTYLLPGHPEVFVVSNIIENGRAIGMADAGRVWHSDMCFTPNPPRCSLFYALEVPEENGEPRGDTWFASTQAAYDALPADLQRRIDGLQVINSLSYYIDKRTAALAGATEGNAQAERQRRRAEHPDAVHPLVRRHPVTGRKCLYLSEDTTRAVVGLDPAESDRLIADLLAHMVRPEFVYRHRYRVGDLVIWDNCSSIHRGVGDFALPQRRRMHRTTISAMRAAA